jgi:hypothetical protein
MGLLRMARLPREVAAGILAAIGDLLGLDDAARAITVFDGMSEAEVAQRRAWLSSSSAYQSAIATLEGARG